MVLPRSSMLRALPEFYIGHPQLLRVARVAERFAWGL
jgi:hypothetical protein